MSEQGAYRLAWRLLRAAYGTPANIARETHCRTAKFAAEWLADVIFAETTAPAGDR